MIGTKGVKGSSFPSVLGNLYTEQVFCVKYEILSRLFIYMSTSYLGAFQNFFCSSNMIGVPMAQNNVLDAYFIKIQRFLQVQKIFWLLAISSIEQNSPDLIAKSFLRNWKEATDIFCNVKNYLFPFPMM